MRPDKLTVGDLLTTDSQVWSQSWDLRVLTRTALFSPVRDGCLNQVQITPLGTGKEFATRETWLKGKITCAVEFQGLREGVISRVGKGDCLHSWASCGVK